MQRFLVIMLLALSVVALGLPAATHAAEVTQREFSGYTVQALFSDIDAATCLRTHVGLQAIEDRTQSMGQPTVRSSALISIYQGNFCTGETLLAATGVTDVPLAALQVDQRLKTATFNATLNAFDDVTAAWRPVEVSLAWTATGDPSYQEKEHSQWSEPGFRINSYTSGTSRPAVASGSVSLAGSRNLTPAPSEWGRIKDARIGSVEISQ